MWLILGLRVRSYYFKQDCPFNYRVILGAHGISRCKLRKNLSMKIGSTPASFLYEPGYIPLVAELGSSHVDILEIRVLNIASL